MEVVPKEPNPWWLRGTAIVMGLMFLLSLGQIASSILVPMGMERLSSTEWEDIAGEYPDEGDEREQDEWREGEVFWDESIDYWESIIESGIFEISAVFSMVLILLSAASIPVLWNGDRELGLKLVSGWLVGFMSSQIVTTLMFYRVGFMPQYSEVGDSGMQLWFELTETFSLTLSVVQIVICNSCLAALLVVVAARSKVSDKNYDLESAFHSTDS
ncbi:MAG TPA: hypothetical protein HA247_05855 [Candidatus Thalassarchaeaceae archaeon]|nr:hypothetical protein [Euryarchaeota archaeon]DAC42509.1 MAG TPA: hypothetical protein D7H98_05890 [Candidatus Poseidoniales archaeon]HII90526.1 hypothetical protein [Candidatus Thalassarchaeaceae archaeon]